MCIRDRALAAAGADVVAHDGAAQRMRDLGARAARAGARVDTADTGELAALGPFDMVLCDAPCSGSGAWRRSPDAKWRFTPQDLRDLTQVQDGILDAAAPLVAPGGVLAYATCSLIAAENHRRVAAFLDRHRGWVLETEHRWTPLDGGDGFYLGLIRAPEYAGR